MTHCTERLLSLFSALWKDYSVFLWDRYWEFGVNGVLGQFKPKSLTAFQCLPDSSFLFAFFLSHPSSIVCFWCENQRLQQVSKRYRYLKKPSDNSIPVCFGFPPYLQLLYGHLLLDELSHWTWTGTEKDLWDPVLNVLRAASMDLDSVNL